MTPNKKYILTYMDYGIMTQVYCAYATTTKTYPNPKYNFLQTGKIVLYVININLIFLIMNMTYPKQFLLQQAVGDQARSPLNILLSPAQDSDFSRHLLALSQLCSGWLSLPNSFALKMFLFQFVNLNSSIFYIAFFLGR